MRFVSQCQKLRSSQSAAASVFFCLGRLVFIHGRWYIWVSPSSWTQQNIKKLCAPGCFVFAEACIIYAKAARSKGRLKNARYSMTLRCHIWWSWVFGWGIFLQGQHDNCTFQTIPWDDSWGGAPPAPHAWHNPGPVCNQQLGDDIDEDFAAEAQGWTN